MSRYRIYRNLHSEEIPQVNLWSRGGNTSGPRRRPRSRGVEILALFAFFFPIFLFESHFLRSHYVALAGLELTM